VTRHSQRDLVEKEEKCEHEAFVTDPCTIGWGSAEITSNLEKKTFEPGFCSNLRSAGSSLNRQRRRDAVGEEEKDEYQAFVTNLGRQSESVRLRKFK
jgi:transcription initiation factor TFIIIB Brf1 subunit/transcription initiation factor TFIIB